MRLCQNTFPRKLQAFRHVVYTCYQPASMATQADLCKKQKAYEQYLLTTHWPAMNIRLYERNQAIGELPDLPGITHLVPPVGTDARLLTVQSIMA